MDNYFEAKITDNELIKKSWQALSQKKVSFWCDSELKMTKFDG